MRELLAELRDANKKFEKVVGLAQSLTSLEAALNSLTVKVESINKAMFHNNGSGGIITRMTLIEQRMDQAEHGWQRWIPIFGSVCGALALVLAALIKAGV